MPRGRPCQHHQGPADEDGDGRAHDEDEQGAPDRAAAGVGEP
ncbi:hypothetical protein [Streptomyces sp. 8N616]